MRLWWWRPRRPALALLPLLAWLLAGAAAAALPDFAAVQAAWRPSEAWLLDRHSRVLQEMRLDPAVRRTDWTHLADISPAMQAATLLAEDRGFFDHAGVDWLAAAKAALTNWLAERPRGASTISMQVAALLDLDGNGGTGRRNVAEKWRQMAAARELEAHWSKPQILEAYLNLVAFRGDLVGIDAASRALFDKRPAGLGSAESLLLAALIRAPAAKPDRVGQRACVLAAALPAGPTCAEITALARNSLTGRYPIVAAADLAPHLARQRLQRPGERQPSSLDADIQRLVIDQLDEQLRLLAGHQANDAAALVVDNGTGEVLAYVSRSGGASRSRQSDGVQARRQAGSTLKPFLYGLALERRHLTAASPIEDRPLALATPGGGYAPANYDHRYRGLASVRQALAGSLNIPAVRTLDLLGADAFLVQLDRLGFTRLDEAADFYGPSLALGSLDVSLWELVAAYRSLADAGRYLPLRLDREPAAAIATRARQVVSPAVAFVVADILADREARATTFGLENVLATRYWSAVKTGTSKDMRDNWCIGFSDRYTVGVWLGNFDGEPMHAVSGISGAAPAWRRIMDDLHAGHPSLPPRPPAGLVRQRIDLPREPGRPEWFLVGTAPAGPAWQPATPPTRIVRPAEGDILALDPDIPAGHQRLTPRAAPPVAGGTWRLDGERLGEGAGWGISRGEHVLTLVDEAEQPVDQVRFQVR